MKLTTYVKEVKKEMKHVSWPTRKQAISFTVVTIAIALVTSAYLGLLDFLLTRLLSIFV